MKQRPRVLVVDDEPDDVAIARRELGPGFDVDSVGSAAEARERLRHEKFDLVVLDYRLGDSNALAFLGESKAERGPAVIVVSGRDDPRVAAAAHELGAFGFLAKDSFRGGVLAALATEALAASPGERRKPGGASETVIARLSEALYAADEEGVIVLANPAFERLVGFGPRELLGQGLERVMGPEALGAIASCLANGDAFVETELAARGGEPIPVLASPTPLRDPGGHLAVVRDFRVFRMRIGGLEKANRKLRDDLVEVAVQVLHNVGNALSSLDVRVEDLQREIDADEEALAILRHAATALHGQTELVDLIRDAARTVDEARSARGTAVAQIRRGVAHAARAIDYARSFAGKTRHGEALLDLGRVVETACSLAHDLARGKGLEVRIVCDVERDAPRLPLPETSFEQLLLNLLKNAIESIAARVERDPAAPREVTLRAAIEEGKLRISVHDTGQGAEPVVAARAFDFGFTTKQEGSGFGLHASAELVERLGGRIRLDSPGPGQGATVSLEVPLGAASRAAA